MFASVERRLAILNVSVVLAIVALVGIGTWTLLRQSLDEEADTALESRITTSRESLDNLPSMTPGSATASQVQDQQGLGTAASDDEEDDDHHDDEHEEESREILISGDTLLFVFDADGRLVTNPRNVVLNSIPNEDSLDEALSGDTDTRIITVDGERVRVRTEPVEHDDEIVGAIQAVRSEAEHDAELALVRNMTLIGSGVGILVAVPTGIYLTRRAMAPINDVLHRQRAFVADASHELRTPLTVLRANAELLERTPGMSREERETELRAIIGEIDTMAHLVDELLQLSRADDPAYAVSLESMPLQPSIDRVTKALGPLAATSGITIDQEPASLQIRSNPALLEQVLRILLDNAIRYTPAGGTVTISAHRHRDHALVEVRDTGIGIPPADLPYVFDRFYRADKARTRATGTGLGLSIAHALMTLLGGTISIASEPGAGTTVRLTLPAPPSAPAGPSTPVRHS